MGKKAKKNVKKIPDEEEAEEEVQQEKPKKVKSKSSFDLKDIFSESIRGRLSQYISLNQEVLNLKGQAEGTDNSEEIEERKAKMSNRVEQAATDILRLELSSLEDWIGEQQVHLSDDIVKLGKVYDDNKANLQATNAFKQSEILSMVSPIQQRSNERQAFYDSYGQLIRRSKDIFC